jgi:hypothetical protein
MVVRVENRCQVPDQAIVTDNDTVIGHANRTSVDKDTLAEHKGAILGSTHLDCYRLGAQEQTSARDRSSRVPPLQSPRINCDGGPVQFAWTRQGIHDIGSGLAAERF